MTITKQEADTVYALARALEDTGRLCSLAESDDKLEWRRKNQETQCALQDVLKQLQEPESEPTAIEALTGRTRLGFSGKAGGEAVTDREAFEKWAESNGFDADKTDEGIYRVKSTDAMYGGWVAGMNRAVEVHSRLCAEWARICEYQKRHGVKVGAQECANIIRGHLPINHPAKQEVKG